MNEDTIGVIFEWFQCNPFMCKGGSMDGDKTVQNEKVRTAYISLEVSVSL